MMDWPLTISRLFAHGRAVYGPSVVATYEGADVRRATFTEVAERTEKLGAALQRLGVNPGDRVATFSWNHQEHLEAYLAVPSLGAVLHTLNIRLFPDQLVYIVNHAEDRVIMVDDSLVATLAPLLPQMETVEHVIVIGNADCDAPAGSPRFEDLLAAEDPGIAWPKVDERSAAAMCYTSGTTGNPKGVVYSHRSIFLHSLMEVGATSLTERDRILPVVPMFHANAWGLAHSGWLTGADFIMPGRYLQPEHLTKIIGGERATLAAAVPTIWNDILRFAGDGDADLSSLRMIVCGGAAVPRSLMERFAERFGVDIIQAWGLTETGPLAALSFPPKHVAENERMGWRSKAGRLLFGVELRITDDEGKELPRDGESVGEIEVRGPWVTGAYYGVQTPEKFNEGWLRTGDVGAVDDVGYIRISDRAKDVIKSGGEWISSVDLETLLLGHPAVAEAAVIGVADERWTERPLACVVLRDGATATPGELREFLSDKVVKWWLPERWTFIDAIPRTSVGKFDKKVLRAQHADGKLTIEQLD
jgi:fatty-acyl-CoA synthase